MKIPISITIKKLISMSPTFFLGTFLIIFLNLATAQTQTPDSELPKNAIRNEIDGRIIKFKLKNEKSLPTRDDKNDVIAQSHAADEKVPRVKYTIFDAKQEALKIFRPIIFHEFENEAFRLIGQLNLERKSWAFAISDLINWSNIILNDHNYFFEPKQNSLMSNFPGWLWTDLTRLERNSKNHYIENHVNCISQFQNKELNSCELIQIANVWETSEAHYISIPIQQQKNMILIKENTIKNSSNYRAPKTAILLQEPERKMIRITIPEIIITTKWFISRKMVLDVLFGLPQSDYFRSSSFTSTISFSLKNNTKSLAANPDISNTKSAIKTIEISDGFYFLIKNIAGQTEIVGWVEPNLSHSNLSEVSQ